MNYFLQSGWLSGEVASLRVPALSSQVRDAAEGVVVLPRHRVHVIPQGAQANVLPIEAAVQGQLHPEAVVREGMAQEPGLQVLNRLDERPALRRDHRRAAQLGLHVNAAEGFEVYAGRQQASELAEEESSSGAMQWWLVVQVVRFV